MSRLKADGVTRDVSVDELRPHERNRRRITTEMFERLRHSIRHDPELLQARPVLALVDGRIIGGRFRWEAVKAEGWSTVPTFALDVDEDRALTIMLRDNNPFGEDDDDVIAEILYDLQQRRADLTLTGLSDRSVKAILASVSGSDGVDELKRDEDLPALPKRARSKRGVVYELGPHRIIAGDSRDRGVVDELFAGRQADLLFTSPPYNIDVDYDTHVDEHGSWEGYSSFLQSVLEPWVERLAPGRALCWNIGVRPRTFPHRQLVLLEQLGLEFYRQMIWRKVGVPLPSWFRTVKAMRARHFEPHWTHEVVYVLSNGPLERGGGIDAVDELVSNDVFELHQSQATVDIPAGAKIAGKNVDDQRLNKRSLKAHPAVFPVRLPQMFAAHLTAPGELIVDPFAGVGSTIIAAEKIERVCYGCELDPRYVDVARDRYARFVEQTELAKEAAA